jgi:hypothetical protein
MSRIVLRSRPARAWSERRPNRRASHKTHHRDRWVPAAPEAPANSSNAQWDRVDLAVPANSNARWAKGGQGGKGAKAAKIVADLGCPARVDRRCPFDTIAIADLAPVGQAAPADRASKIDKAKAPEPIPASAVRLDHKARSSSRPSRSRGCANSANAAGGLMPTS